MRRMSQSPDTTRAGGGSDEERLVDKLRKIEALFAGAATPGERMAAGTARERILRRIRDLEYAEAPVEYRFTLADGWSRSLFTALLQRYALRPYRYRGQRRTTVMVRVAASFANEVLWPEFLELSRTLHEHLEAVTARVIREAIHRGDAVVEERADSGGAAGNTPHTLSEE
jgi:hypothetical protein